MSLISSNSPNLREDDVINEARNGAYQKPVSAYQMKLANERVDATNLVVAKTVKMVSIPVDGDAFTAELAFSNTATGLEVGDTILEILLTCDTAVTGGTMTLKHGGGGAAISSVLTCAVANVVSRTTSLISPVITADGLSVLSASADDRGTFTIMYI